jgi:hypothetical protein
LAPGYGVVAFVGANVYLALETVRVFTCLRHDDRRQSRASGVDDIVAHFLAAGKILFQIVFSMRVTLNEQKWVTLLPSAED